MMKSSFPLAFAAFTVAASLAADAEQPSTPPSVVDSEQNQQRRMTQTKEWLERFSQQLRKAFTQYSRIDIIKKELVAQQLDVGIPTGSETTGLADEEGQEGEEVDSEAETQEFARLSQAAIHKLQKFFERKIVALRRIVHAAESLSSVVQSPPKQRDGEEQEDEDYSSSKSSERSRRTTARSFRVTRETSSNESGTDAMKSGSFVSPPPPSSPSTTTTTATTQRSEEQLRQAWNAVRCAELSRAINETTHWGPLPAADVAPTVFNAAAWPNASSSTVHVALNEYKCDEKILDDYEWTNDVRFTDVLKDNAVRDSGIARQYIGTYSGLTRAFPPFKWEALPRAYTVDLFDSRYRPWFVNAETAPRDILFLIDFSGSVRGLTLHMVKSLIVQILQTLSPNDFFTGVWYNNRRDLVLAECMPKAHGAKFIPATTRNKMLFLRYLDRIEEHDQATLPPAFNFSFAQFLENAKLSGPIGGGIEFERERRTSGGHKQIILFTDGIEYWPVDEIRKYQRENPRDLIRVFGYTMGRSTTRIRALDWITCTTGGAARGMHVGSVGEVRAKSRAYLGKLMELLALIYRGKSATQRPVSWTTPYMDAQKMGAMVSLSAPVLDLRPKRWWREQFRRRNESDASAPPAAAFRAIAGVDFTLSELRRMLDGFGVHTPPSAEQTVDAARRFYAFIVDNNGVVQYHPLLRLPKPEVYATRHTACHRIAKVSHRGSNTRVQYGRADERQRRLMGYVDSIPTLDIMDVEFRPSSTLRKLRERIITGECRDGELLRESYDPSAAEKSEKRNVAEHPLREYRCFHIASTPFSVVFVHNRRGAGTRRRQVANFDRLRIPLPTPPSLPEQPGASSSSDSHHPHQQHHHYSHHHHHHRNGHQHPGNVSSSKEAPAPQPFFSPPTINNDPLGYWLKDEGVAALHCVDALSGVEPRKRFEQFMRLAERSQCGGGATVSAATSFTAAAEQRVSQQLLLLADALLKRWHDAWPLARPNVAFYNVSTTTTSTTTEGSGGLSISSAAIEVEALACGNIEADFPLPKTFDARHFVAAHAQVVPAAASAFFPRCQSGSVIPLLDSAPPSAVRWQALPAWERVKLRVDFFDVEEFDAASGTPFNGAQQYHGRQPTDQPGDAGAVSYPSAAPTLVVVESLLVDGSARSAATRVGVAAAAQRAAAAALAIASVGVQFAPSFLHDKFQRSLATASTVLGADGGAEMSWPECQMEDQRCFLVTTTGFVVASTEHKFRPVVHLSVAEPQIFEHLINEEIIHKTTWTDYQAECRAPISPAAFHSASNVRKQLEFQRILLQQILQEESGLPNPHQRHRSTMAAYGTSVAADGNTAAMGGGGRCVRETIVSGVAAIARRTLTALFWLWFELITLTWAQGGAEEVTESEQFSVHFLHYDVSTAPPHQRQSSADDDGALLPQQTYPSSSAETIFHEAVIETGPTATAKPEDGGASTVEARSDAKEGEDAAEEEKEEVEEEEEEEKEEEEEPETDVHLPPVLPPPAALCEFGAGGGGDDAQPQVPHERCVLEHTQYALRAERPTVVPAVNYRVGCNADLKILPSSSVQLHLLVLSTKCDHFPAIPTRHRFMPHRGLCPSFGGAGCTGFGVGGGSVADCGLTNTRSRRFRTDLDYTRAHPQESTWRCAYVASSESGAAALVSYSIHGHGFVVCIFALLLTSFLTRMMSD